MQYNRYKRVTGNREGLTLIIALSILAIIAMIGIFSSKKAVMEQRIANNQKLNTTAFYIAEAGLEHAQAVLANDFAADLPNQSAAAQPSWTFKLTETGNTANSFYCQGCDTGPATIYDGPWTTGGAQVLQNSNITVGGYTYTYTVTAWNNNDGGGAGATCVPGGSATVDCDGAIVIRSVARGFRPPDLVNAITESMQEKVLVLNPSNLFGAVGSGMNQEFGTGKTSADADEDVATSDLGTSTTL